MKVFISWSGERSKKVGELLDEWLQCVLQAVDPWMSSKDIDRGSLWFSEINDQLKDTSIGVVCLTRENLNKPWILFEAGALAKGLNSTRVCTLLIDLESTDISDPLAQFNHTLPTQSSIWGLVRTINSSLGERSLKERVLENVFMTYWPQFEERFNAILSEVPDTSPEVRRNNDDILVELLQVTRGLDKRVRYMERDQQHSVKMTNEEFDKILFRLKNKGFDLEQLLEVFTETYGIPYNVVHRRLMENDFTNMENKNIELKQHFSIIK
ncbi:toll/interleukin-1 receptor domain-containing protein [Paenibacillus rigui]|uniref:Toll-Interleukin receptor n=1 Tax=Paenibacillus rigui TaxID=554312 RepID=A0A229UM83_9BACL|nr:toll/interleukin-1 receptor domain-containing protein [Paenibacillus rigui]OXM84577.1 toll-Interleukin receptor [Paenibacillus rigui]